MSVSQYIIIALIIAVFIMALRMCRMRIKNRWEGEHDFGIACVDTNEKICALTFDDGPDPVLTPLVLDTLRKHGIKATFFLLGKNAAKYPDIVKRIALDGHDIGNHTMTHAELSQQSEHKTLKEIRLTQNILQGITGQAPNMIRPPKGKFSKEQEDIVREHFGFPRDYVITWDICTYDWEGLSQKQLVDLVREETRPGSILLFHDVHHCISHSLEAVILELQNEGYSFLPVSELLTRGAPLQMRD